MSNFKFWPIKSSERVSPPPLTNIVKRPIKSDRPFFVKSQNRKNDTF